MNEDILKGKWKQLQGEVQMNWGKLTHDDIEQIKGSVQLLEGKIQEKYGKSQDEAKKQIGDFLKKFSI
jgi:uncharacterized protein YjbJ (UPF0337 family)